MGIFGRRKQNTGFSDNSNALPQHTHPDEVRDSYATEQTRVGTATEPTSTFPKYGDAELDSNTAYNTSHNTYTQGRTYHSNGVTAGATDGVPTVAHYPPANYRYDDGVYDARP